MCNRSYTLIRSILLIILALPLVAEGKSPVIRIDMNNYRVGDLDKEIKQISCLKLKKSHYDTTRQLVFYKDRIYVMGYTIAGASVLIYDLAGNFIKEIRLPDAIAVNSMTAIPQLNELWITSYGKFIKKGMSPTILSVLTWSILHPATSCCFRTISTRSTLSISRRRSFSPCSTLIFTEIS